MMKKNEFDLLNFIRKYGKKAYPYLSITVSLIRLYSTEVFVSKVNVAGIENT